MATSILAIDPGINGGLAVYDPTKDNGLYVANVPVIKANKKNQIDATQVAEFIWSIRVNLVHAFVEQVGAMPEQGVASTFRFGDAFGVLRGVVAANFIPLTYVKPNQWKRKLGVPADKDAARLRASQLFPTFNQLWRLKKDLNKAEAACLAYYGAHLWLKGDG